MKKLFALHLTTTVTYLLNIIMPFTSQVNLPRQTDREQTDRKQTISSQ